MQSPSSGSNATLILVLGILSIVLCPIMGPVAWIMGNKALAEIDSGAGDPSQRGLVNAGRICGIVGTVLIVVGCGIGFLSGLAGVLSGAGGVPR